MVKQRFLVLLLALFLALPAVAEEEVRLSLAETLRAALENNLDLVSARLDPEISEQGVIAQDAEFDPGIQSQAMYSSYKREPRRIFEPSGTGDTVSANVGVAQAFKFGGDAQMQLESSREIGDAVPFEPFYQGTLSLVFNVPLLRGAGREPTTEQLLLARGNLGISREQLRERAHAVMESVENAYWDLVASNESLRIARLSLTRAQDLLDLNRKKVEVGTLAPIEITEAQAGVASQEETVIIEETNLQNAEDELRRLLAVPASDPMWNKVIVPLDKPAFEAVQLDLGAAIEQALSSRPEIASAAQEVKNSELSERVARNAMKPGIDLALRAMPQGNNNNGLIYDDGPDGIPGTPDDIPLGYDKDSYAKSISEISELNNFYWDAQVTFSIPIGNRAAKANHKTAQLNLKKSEIAMSNEEQSIRVEVRRAVRSVESGVKRVNAARVNVELQRKKLDAEHKKFDNGMSTSFEILTFQRDLAAAELSEVNALIDYNKALVALEKSKGTLLQARGLSLAE